MQRKEARRTEKKYMDKLRGICLWCMGCNKLEDMNFAGVYRCKNFIAAQISWEEEYRKGLRKNEV